MTRRFKGAADVLSEHTGAGMGRWLGEGRKPRPGQAGPFGGRWRVRPIQPQGGVDVCDDGPTSSREPCGSSHTAIFYTPHTPACLPSPTVT